MELPHRKYQEIVVSLDALLDTRLATLATHDSELAKRVLESGTYHNRLYDEFEDVTIDDFKAMYAARDKEVLKRATLTRIIRFIAELCAGTTTEASQNPTAEYPSVVINVYPYKLDEEEMKMITLAVRSYLAEEVPVRTENRPWNEFDPVYCRERVSTIIVYNNEEWMEANSKAFQTCVCPKVTLFASGIFHDEKHETEDIIKITELAMTPFDSIEFMASPIIAMKLMNVSEFSVFR